MCSIETHFLSYKPMRRHVLKGVGCGGPREGHIGVPFEVRFLQKINYGELWRLAAGNKKVHQGFQIEPAMAYDS